MVIWATRLPAILLLRLRHRALAAVPVRVRELLRELLDLGFNTVVYWRALAVSRQFRRQVSKCRWMTTEQNSHQLLPPRKMKWLA
jgi:hypothetical protein